MKDRPDLTALLDVQHPEPPADESEFYSLPNVLLSGHIAGSKGSEFRRMADYMVEELKLLMAGKPLKYAADLETVRSKA
jgi:phosphoglycerate dehydrogenase-like enzyme